MLLDENVFECAVQSKDKIKNVKELARTVLFSPICLLFSTFRKIILKLYFQK